jgi:hypothetical protein
MQLLVASRLRGFSFGATVSDARHILACHDAIAVSHEDS